MLWANQKHEELGTVSLLSSIQYLIIKKSFLKVMAFWDVMPCRMVDMYHQPLGSVIKIIILILNTVRT
jgi:hypothetical protein